MNKNNIENKINNVINELTFNLKQWFFFILEQDGILLHI